MGKFYNTIKGSLKYMRIGPNKESKTYQAPAFVGEEAKGISEKADTGEQGTTK